MFLPVDAMADKYTYVETITWGAEDVVRRIDATGLTQYWIGRKIMAAAFLLNPQYHVRVQEYKEAQPLVDLLPKP
jgi:hypothetical protein